MSFETTILTILTGISTAGIIAGVGWVITVERRLSRLCNDLGGLMGKVKDLDAEASKREDRVRAIELQCAHNHPE
jgi:hypothetical protein